MTHITTVIEENSIEEIVISSIRFFNTELSGVQGQLLFKVNESRSLATIMEVYVEDSFRRQGIGTQLINELVSWLKDHYCNLSIIEVDSLDYVTNFYKSNGFQVGFQHLKLVRMWRQLI